MTTPPKSPAKHCAVIGDPVAHSKSPRIHSLFAEQSGIALDYEAITVNEEQLASFVSGFFALGGLGLNVTVPLKEHAFRLCAATSPRATIAAAVNTLYLMDGELQGENTDGPGLIRDIQRNHGFDLGGARTLVLGAGGAVRGVLAAFAEIDIGEIVVANRTLERAQKLQSDLQQQLVFSVCGFDEIPRQPFDLVINGTSASLAGELPPLSASLVKPGSCCYDLMYASEDTPFVSWARAAGAGLAIDGLGMLVEQAADAFEIWHGMRPDTLPVIAELRAH